MFTALLIFQVVLGISMIGLILLQQGKGADMGAAFGAGASGTVFGARGGGSFFSRATAVMAALFFANSVLLSSPLVLGDRHPTGSVTDSVATENLPEAPPEKVEVPADAVDMPPADMPEVNSDAGAKPAADSAPEAPAASGKAETAAAPAASSGKASGKDEKAAAPAAPDADAAGAADKKPK